MGQSGLTRANFRELGGISNLHIYKKKSAFVDEDKSVGRLLCLFLLSIDVCFCGTAELLSVYFCVYTLPVKCLET